jgi:hypothetical protein
LSFKATGEKESLSAMNLSMKVKKSNMSVLGASMQQRQFAMQSPEQQLQVCHRIIKYIERHIYSQKEYRSS